MKTHAAHRLGHLGHRPFDVAWHETSTQQVVIKAERAADERYDNLRRQCPVCGQLGVRIVYGYPTAPLVTAAQEGKLLLGGCTYLSATHHCPRGHEWHSPDCPDLGA